MYLHLYLVFAVSTIPEEEEEQMERSLRLAARAGGMEVIQEQVSE